MKHLTIHSDLRGSSGDSGPLQDAAAIVRSGGIVAFPTDTLYGIAADPFNAEAVEKVFVAKGRTTDRALPLVAADITQVESALGKLPEIGAWLAARFWPGPLTIVIAALPAVSAVSGGTGGVGVRVPGHPIARALCRAVGQPLTATSANRSGEPPTDDPAVVASTLAGYLDALVDGGRSPGGAPSTVVDVTTGEARLVRAGAISWEQVLACLRRD
jgi:L-threonylcarbamoyladenylate synthase